MIQIIDKTKCCGCTACYNICPTHAIEMSADEEGFFYPVVNQGKCVNCGLCDKVCPVLNKENHTENTKGYIVRYNDYSVVEQSTSGGAFSAFAIHLMQQGAIVYGTGYDENMQVICKTALREDELQEMRGSKFVQSNLGISYKKVKEELKKRAAVLFTGTPCQIAGLINYLGGKPDNLICIDFVCRGVPSPALWKNYVVTMEKKYNSKMTGARFKHKTYGYHATTMKIDFANNKTWYGSGRVDPMMKAFVNELASRPSCSQCAFKSVERLSDITMFDCYKFSQITGEHDDDKGYTSLFVHTKKGENLLKSVSACLTIYPVSVESLVKQNGIMVCNSAKPNPRREEFYRLVQKYSIDEAMRRISPITKKDYLLEKMKGFLYKTGLIKAARKIKKKKRIEIT